MSLVVQLNGYDRSKLIVSKFANCQGVIRYPSRDYDYRENADDIADVHLIEFQLHELKNALLEYRRQHNIYEAGDWVFTNNEDFSEEPCQLIEDMGYDFKYETKSGHWGFIVKSFLPKAWRHATDAEIEAGKRLNNEEKH